VSQDGNQLIGIVSRSPLAAATIIGTGEFDRYPIFASVVLVSPQILEFL
jgi:hypothetical protein